MSYPRGSLGPNTQHSPPDNLSADDIIAIIDYVCWYACKDSEPTGATSDLFKDMVNTVDAGDADQVSSSASSESLRNFIPLWPVTLAICSELTIFAFFSFLTVVFLALWFVSFFLAFFKASTSYGYFYYVSYGIFAHWLSSNQIFKFTVSFATEVEKTDHRMDVLIEAFALRVFCVPFSSNK